MDQEVSSDPLIFSGLVEHCFAPDSGVGSDSSLGPSDLAVDHATTDEQTMAEVQMMAEELMTVEEQTMAVDKEALEFHIVDDAHEATLDMKGS